MAATGTGHFGELRLVHHVLEIGVETVGQTESVACVSLVIHRAESQILQMKISFCRESIDKMSQILHSLHVTV